MRALGPAAPRRAVPAPGSGTTGIGDAATDGSAGRWRPGAPLACHNHAVSVTEIAGYRVIRQLGAGGMGQVFLVQHPRLPRQDALKLLDAGVSRNDDFKARFQREADLLAQLSHSNIVTLHDRGEFEGRLWITMEYVEGTDASELLKAAGPVDAALALSLVSAAGAALDYAWRKQRVTHRDVKPANILVGIDDAEGVSQVESVKLADFGIAKAAGESTSLTTTGMTLGTMQYMSPEAIEGEVVDNRSDIYSLGCTAFHLLAGQPPFTGTTIAATMSAHLTKLVPSISAVNEHLPQSTDAVFERVLAKNPADRYESCAEFVTALQEAIGGEVPYPASAPTLAATTSPKRTAADPDAPTQLRKGEVPAVPLQRKSRKVPILASAVAVLAVAATVLGVFATRGGNDDTPSNRNTPTTETPTTPASAPSSPPITTSLAPPPPPPPVTMTPEAITPPPPQVPALVPPSAPAALAPYEGMPCTTAEFNQVTADGTLYCSAMTGSWRDKTHQSRPAVQVDTPCSEPGARARVAQTDGLATCQVGPDGNLVWSW